MSSYNCSVVESLVEKKSLVAECVANLTLHNEGLLFASGHSKKLYLSLNFFGKIGGGRFLSKERNEGVRISQSPGMRTLLGQNMRLTASQADWMFHAADLADPHRSVSLSGQYETDLRTATVMILREACFWYMDRCRTLGRGALDRNTHLQGIRSFSFENGWCRRRFDSRR